MPTQSGFRVGIALPQGFPEGVVDLDLVRRAATRAEELGFDDLWSIDQILGSITVLESLTLLSYVAAITSRIRLGTAVIVVNHRNPVTLAKELSSLDQLSKGRLTAGIGLGTSARLHPAFGIPEEHRVSRFIEAVRVMKALWAEPRADLPGRFWRLENAAMEPKPAQRPHLPLWFGAHVPDAMRRAARFGDGWIGAGSTPFDDFFVEVKKMREILEEGGRDPAAFSFSKRLYLAVDSDKARGRERLRRWIGAYYGNPDLADRWGFVGPAQECLELLAKMREAGLTHVLLNPVYDYVEQMETIAEKITPNL